MYSRCAVPVLFVLFLSHLSVTSGLCAGKNACALLTMQEVERCIGSPVKKGELTTFAPFIGGSMCIYESREKGGHYASVMLRPRDSEAAAINIFKHNYSIKVPPPVVFDGLGDEAMWRGKGIEPDGGLHIRKGRYLIDIKVKRGEKDSENMAGAVELAEPVLNRVP